MKSSRITALFMIFLVVNSTLIYGDIFDSIQDPKEKIDDTAEALSDFQETDIIINVDNYYPTVLAEQAFESDQPGGYPVTATLTGIKTNPLMDLQKIERINVRAAGGSTKYVRNIYHKQPTKGYLNVDNLGYIVIRLKKLKENDVPKRLDINMTASITYKIQNGFGVNEQDLTLPILSEEEFLQRRSEFSFYGGRGYIRLADIKGDTAYFVVYDGDLTKTSFSVRLGGEPQKKFLSGGVPYLLFSDKDDFIGRNLRNRYEVRVNQISGNKDTAKVEMLFNGEYKLKELSEGQYIYPGSKWKVRDIRTTNNDEVEFYNEDTREKLILKGGKYYVPEEAPEVEKEVPGIIISSSQAIKWVEEYSERYDIDPNLVKGLINAESSWKMQWTDEARNYIKEKKSENKDYIIQDMVVMQGIKDKKIDSSAFGYGQMTHTTAKWLSERIWGEEDANKRFDSESNIHMTVYYLGYLLTKNKDNKRNALIGYTGYSGGEDHIKKILAYAEEYENNVGKIPFDDKEKEEIKIADTFNEEYKQLNEELKDLMKTKKQDFNEVKLILDKYKDFFDRIAEKDDETLFNKYRGFILKDLIAELEPSYRPVSQEISDKIRSYITSNFDFSFSRKDFKPAEEVKIKEDSPEYYFLKAIESYRIVADEYYNVIYEENENNGEDIAMKAQIRIAEIYDYNLRDNDKAIEEYTKLINNFNYPEENVIEDRIKFLELRRGYFSSTVNIIESENAISLTLYSIKQKGADDTAVISIDGKTDAYSLKKNNLGDTGWLLKEVNEDYATVFRYEKDKDGVNRESEPKRLRLNKEEILIINGKNNAFILQKVELNQQAYITILPGEERITTQTDFMLHIPVEPRLWRLSPEQMSKTINETRKFIDNLNRAISTIENIYKIWSISCYATFSILWIKNTWLTGPAKTLARKEVISGWKEECNELAKDKNSIYKGDTFKCIVDRKNDIDKDLEKAKKIHDSNKDANERIKALAKEGFINENLNNKYRSESFDVILNQKIESGFNSLMESLEEGQEKSSMLMDKKRAEATINAYNYMSSNEEELKKESKLRDEDFEKIKITSYSENSNLDSEKVRGSVVNINNDYYLQSEGNHLWKVYSNDNGKTFYGNFKEGKYSNKIELVDEPVNIQDNRNYQKSVTLVDSGKWKGYVNMIAVDSIHYLKVPEESGRGGDGRPLRVELWTRRSGFFERNNLPMGTKDDVRDGLFALNDCKLGRTSEDLNRDTLKSLILSAPNLQQACRDLENIDSTINIKERKAGETIKGYAIQYAIQETGGLQCFDIMDVGDCLTLFSVCDPVMCPASRFTAGGAWKVDNVVSTGIFGSIFLGLGLWDFKRVPPEVGICIPGVDAGLKNWRSLSEGFEQCMITRRDKGENVGICDTIRSIGICKIAWREGTSFIKLGGGALDSLLGIIFPSARGGGEYAFFQSNIRETGDFLNFFTKEYATTYFSAYRGASTDEIGEELCKAAIYGKVPGVGNLIDKLTRPEGPAQFIGWFTEIPNNDLAGQLLSDYEIYYHIYAGEDREQVKYYVYLKDLDDLSRRLFVTRTTGYLNKGDFVDETVRRTETTGYDELCIVIDGKENCGFQRVSSGLALDIFEDKNLEEDARNKNVKTEQECIGESTVFSDPGVSSFVDALYPGLANNGLIRVCSKENPGKGVSNTIWVQVGSCGKNEIGQELGLCWLSKQSYKDSLSVYDVKRREEAEKFFRELAAQGLLPDKDVKERIGHLINFRNNLNEATKLSQNKEDMKEEFESVVGKFEELIKKTINVELSAKLNYEIGETYYELGLYLKREDIKESPTAASTDNAKEVSKYSCEIEYYDTYPLVNIPNFITKNVVIRYNFDKSFWEWKDRKEYTILKNIISPLSPLSSYVTHFDKGLEIVVDIAKKHNNKLIITIDNNKVTLEKESLTLENLENACKGSFKEKVQTETPKTNNEDNRYFVRAGSGFNLLFEKNKFDIDEKTKNDILLYIEENKAPFSILEIISYTNQENDQTLSQRRLDLILNLLSTPPYDSYIKNAEIKKEARSEISDYTGRESSFAVVQVRFIGPGNKMQSLFEGLGKLTKLEQYEECEFEYDDKHLLNLDTRFKYSTTNKKWDFDFSWLRVGATYKNIFKTFSNNNPDYINGITLLLQFANKNNDIVNIYKNENLIFRHENKIDIDYSLNKIKTICSFVESESVLVKTAQICDKPEAGVNVGDTCRMSDSLTFRISDNIIDVKNSEDIIPDSTIAIKTQTGSLFVVTTDSSGKIDNGLDLTEINPSNINNNLFSDINYIINRVRTNPESEGKLNELSMYIYSDRDVEITVSKSSGSFLIIKDNNAQKPKFIIDKDGDGYADGVIYVNNKLEFPELSFVSFDLVSDERKLDNKIKLISNLKLIEGFGETTSSSISYNRRKFYLIKDNEIIYYNFENEVKSPINKGNQNFNQIKQEIQKDYVESINLAKNVLNNL